MRLPAGTVEGIITNPKKEGLLQYLLTFKGLIETETPSGHGFILINNGTTGFSIFQKCRCIISWTICPCSHEHGFGWPIF